MRVSTAASFQQATQDIQTSLSKISALQDQVGSGKKLSRPSDNPIDFARSIDLNQAIGQLEQYERNRGVAGQQLGLIDASLSSVNNVLQRVRELTIQANNTIQTDETRSIIRGEIEQRLNELLGYANTLNGNGEYLFAGGKGKTQPFTLSASGTVYHGDQTALTIQISTNRTLDISASGYEVFQQIRSGNGTFVVDSDSANAGSGLISPGSVTDGTIYVPHDFSIVFTSPTTYDVVNNTTATTILTAQTYDDGEPINFNGVEVKVSGNIATGDEFTVNASRNQDVFQTLNDLIDTLSITPSDEAMQAQQIQGYQRALGDLDLAIGNILDVRTSVGTRQNALEAAGDEASSAKLGLQQTLSEIEDVDLAEAISRLSFETTTLEAVQATFASIQRLSLFSFLR